MGSWSAGFSAGFGDTMAGHTATITWVDPTQRDNGQPIAPDTFHIDIYDSASSTPHTPIATVAQGVQTWTSGVLSTGTHNFTGTAVDSEGNTSATTPITTVVVPLGAPNPPTNFTAKLN